MSKLRFLNLLVIGFAVINTLRIHAQDAKSSELTSPNRIRHALAATQQQPAVLFVPRLNEWRLGFLTLVPPGRPGEIVRVRVPIGELVMRGPHALARAKRRHAERAAREETARFLAGLHAARP